MQPLYFGMKQLRWLAAKHYSTETHQSHKDAYLTNEIKGPAYHQELRANLSQ